MVRFQTCSRSRLGSDVVAAAYERRTTMCLRLTNGTVALVRVRAAPAAQPGSRPHHIHAHWYPYGPGSSTSTTSGESITTPRAVVIWRRPEPSGRMAKSWFPAGLVPSGSHDELRIRARVPRSCATTWTGQPGAGLKKH